ncbi:hypothetical protein B0H14DRAFT_2800341 [Mycena olivaceomarginata]|nr:hypothetical protein B0H14DRAFT_2800341 [Mycena olivaceomarginata]
MDIYIKLPEFLRRFPPMSAPAEKTQKTPLLLLHGIAPHLFQSRTPLRKSSKLRVMNDSTASHQKVSSGSSESTTSAALEAYEAAQAEVDSLKILLEQRNQENAKLRAALDASRIRLRDASRQIATIGGFQDASASAEVACRAAVAQLKIFLQDVDIE